jgi:PAS domain S-box-containing protein
LGLASALVAKSTDPESFLDFLRWSVSFGILTYSTQTWFLAVYTGMKPKWLLYPLTFSFAVFFLANLVSEKPIQYKELVGIKRIGLPWGETISLGIGPSGPWFIAATFALLVAFIFMIVAAVKHFRAKSTSQSWAILLAVSICAVGTWQGMLVRLSVIDFMQLGPFAFLALVMVMSVALHREYADQRQRIETDQRAMLENELAGLAKVKDQRIVWHNLAMGKMLGYDNEQIVGLDISSLYPDKVEFDESRNSAASIIGHKGVFRTQRELLRKDGSRIWVSLSGILLEPSTATTMWTAVDISEQVQNQNQLRLSEVMRRKAQDIAGLGSYATDLITGVWQSSPALDAIFGIDENFPHDIPHWNSILAPEFQQAALDHYLAVARDHSEFRMDYQIIRPVDGVRRWVAANGELSYNEAGEPVQLIGTIQDITNRKRSEIALAESNSLLKTVIDAIPMRVFWKDKQLNYLGCNTAFAEDAGKHSPAEMIGKDDFQMFWAAQAEGYRADDSEIMRTSRAKLDYEEIQATPDGQMMWLRTSKIPLKNHDGQVFGVLGIYEDITQRKANEDQVRKLSQVAEQSPESVIITDLAGRIEYVNSAFLHKTGYSSTEVLGLDPRVLQTNLTPRSTYEAMWNALKNGTSWSGEMVNQRKDGTIFTEWAIISPLRDKGGSVTHYVAVQEDITEKKRIVMELEEYRKGLEQQVDQRTIELNSARQQAEESNRAKSEFLANMSHEIRTPLNAISGMAALMNRDALTEFQKDKLKKLESAVKHLSQTVNDILDLSKIEANLLALEERPFEVQHVVTNISNMLQPSIDAKGLTLVTDIYPQPLQLLGDPTRLGQALLNYAGNAVKFTDCGSIKIRCTLEEDLVDSVTLRFEVQDSGIGISQDQLPRLFSPFVQADSSTTRKYGGTGLGLSITQKLVAAMGGDVGVDSEFGKGSNFWFRVGLKKSDACTHTAKNERRLDAYARLKASYAGLLVLLAEDDDFNREIGTILLEDVGLQVHIAEDGQAACEMVMQRKYDLVLMDMQMPRMDGLEATRHIRSIDSGKTVPIVAMTANAFAEDRIRCLEAGMSDFLTKPVDPAHLYQVILRQFMINGASEIQQPDGEQVQGDRLS